jgi:outer membrane protein TolC
MRSAVLTARTEIAIAVREVDTASRLLQTRRDALEAAAAEEHYLQRRWELLGTDASSVGLILEDLLDAQQTRTEAEKDLVGSKVEYLQSLARLQTAMGTLLGDAAINPVFDPSDFGVRFERQATLPFHEK